jgi:predicted metal-dependent phosphoesterase TrpH
MRKPNSALRSDDERLAAGRRRSSSFKCGARHACAAIAFALFAGASNAALRLPPRFVLSSPFAVFVTDKDVHLAPPREGASRYAYIAFDVPPHASHISINCSYDRAGGANAIDLGLFDARFPGRDNDLRGFRGWSGGRRDEIYVSTEEATPGYLPGALPAGTWRVILGIYRVAPAGVDVKLRITIETTDDNSHPTTSHDARQAISGSRFNERTQPKATIAPARTSPHGWRWFRGDMHLHTRHSDGDWTVAELAETARSRKLDFIFITDHNTSSHHADVQSVQQSVNARSGRTSPLVLRGEEVTTYGGHFNVLGVPPNRLFDFRVTPTDNMRLRRVVAEAHLAGAIVAVNHPFALCRGCGWNYDLALTDFDAIEVWNGAWDAADESALRMWDELLQKGRRIAAIGSSDTHRQADPPGVPTTHIAARALNERRILEAIKSGRAYITADSASLDLNFYAESGERSKVARREIGGELRLGAPGVVRLGFSASGAPDGASFILISDGKIIHRRAVRRNQSEIFELRCERGTYIRLELRDPRGAMLALTNPVYIVFNR